MQREIATTDGWMVAMLRIYCEFIAMLHHPVGPVAGTGGWLSIYYSIMQQQWNERSRGWVFVLGAPAAGVKSHLITWSLSWSCFYYPAITTNKQHRHITHKQLLCQEGLALLSLWSRMDKILLSVLIFNFLQPASWYGQLHWCHQSMSLTAVSAARHKGPGDWTAQRKCAAAQLTDYQI